LKQLRNIVLIMFICSHYNNIIILASRIAHRFAPPDLRAVWIMPVIVLSNVEVNN